MQQTHIETPSVFVVLRHTTHTEKEVQYGFCIRKGPNIWILWGLVCAPINMPNSCSEHT